MDGHGSCHAIGTCEGDVMGCARDIAGGIDVLNRRHHGAIHCNELPIGTVLKVATDLFGDPAVEGNAGADEQCSEGTEAAVLELDGGKLGLPAH